MLMGGSDDQTEQILIIPAIPNRDWRQSSTRRTQSYRPENPRQDEPMETHERTGGGPQRSGLRYASRTEVETNGETVNVEQTEEAVKPNGSTSTSEVKIEPLTLEEQALRAVLAGDVQRESEEERAQRELVIAMESGATTPMTEDDAFKRDVATLPQEVGGASLSYKPIVDAHQSTLDDYDAVPVSAFGMAMARGMGWNPSSKDNTIVYEPKLRPQLLGLGATPMDVTVRPTHSRGDSKKNHQDRSARSGRGFIATSLLVKKGRDGEMSGSVTPAGVGSADGSDGSRRRRKEDDYHEGGESKRREGEQNGDTNAYRDRHRSKYETDEKRARRKSRERDIERDRERDRYTNGDRERYTNNYEKHREERRNRDDDDRERRREREPDRNGR